MLFIHENSERPIDLTDRCYWLNYRELCLHLQSLNVLSLETRLFSCSIQKEELVKVSISSYG